MAPFLNVKAVSGPAMPLLGPNTISHCEPAYSQLAVMMSTPNCRISLTMRSTAGTHVFRTVLKMW